MGREGGRDGRREETWPAGRAPNTEHKHPFFNHHHHRLPLLTYNIQRGVHPSVPFLPSFPLLRFFCRPMLHADTHAPQQQQQHRRLSTAAAQLAGSCCKRGSTIITITQEKGRAPVCGAVRCGAVRGWVGWREGGGGVKARGAK